MRVLEVGVNVDGILLMMLWFSDLFMLCVLMISFVIVFCWGVDCFFEEVKEVGVFGFIIFDLLVDDVE